MSARSRRPTMVSVSIESSRARASSALSTGVADPAGHIRQAAGNPAELGNQQRCLLRLYGAVRPADPVPDSRHGAMLHRCRRAAAAGLVRGRDSGQVAPDRGRFVCFGELANVERDSFRPCWKRIEAGALAPGFELLPVGTVAAACVLRFRIARVGLRAVKAVRQHCGGFLDGNGYQSCCCHSVLCLSKVRTRRAIGWYSLPWMRGICCGRLRPSWAL
jgi:hypothetical protein